MVNEVWFFTLYHWTRGCDDSISKNYLKLCLHAKKSLNAETKAERCNSKWASSILTKLPHIIADKVYIENIKGNVDKKNS